MGAIIDLMKNFNFEDMLPDLSTTLGQIEFWVRLLLCVGPLLILALGAIYYYKPPKEANFAWGFRTYYGMGSVEAWRYTQKVAGICWMFLGGGMTAVILLVELFLIGATLMTLANVALWCVIIELLLVLASCIAINLHVLKFFDKDGNRR